MEIQYYGANTIKISGKKATVVIDDNLASIGAKSITTKNDIALYTLEALPKVKDCHFMIDSPGEYEVSNVSIRGIPARAHTDEEKGSSATIYRVIINDLRIVAVGHIYPELSDDQLESLGTVDFLLVPIGGNGYTLDGIGAQKIIKKIEPKIIIPTHYADKAIKYEVPQADLTVALKDLAMEPSETLDVLKIKSLEFTDTTKLVVLNRQ